MVNKKLLNPQPVTRNPILRFTHYALRLTHNAQPATNFGANTPPTCQFHAFTLYASRFFLVPRPLPLVPFRDVIFVTVNSKMAKMAGK
jgi:hypothetical protein